MPRKFDIERWRQIESLFHAARERSPSERSVFLIQACAGDEELRREVDSLLSEHDGGGTLLEDVASESAADWVRTQEQITIPQTLGHFRILSRLGEGGMGVVYRAQDTRLGREVAIKVLPDHLAQNDAALARFEREAKAVAALSHPNILAIHDFGSDQGIHFAVMELLEGENLRSHLDKSLPWRKAVEIGAAVADGLAAAHDKGFIHRDLKPENIFLTRDGRVKVLDFGIAKNLLNPGAEPASTHATQDGVILGTPHYMSPEQLLGRDLDDRSDIFSFGIVLYEMVSGHSPFSGSNTIAMVNQIINAEPESIAGVDPDLPAELTRIVEKCLEKDPAKRFQNARELSDALKFLTGYAGISSPVRAASDRTANNALDSGTASFRRLDRKHIAILAIGTTALLIVFIAVLNVGGLRDVIARIGGTTPLDSRPVLPFSERDWILIADVENLTGDKVFDRSLHAALTVGIGQSRYVNVFPQNGINETLQRMRKENVERIDEDLGIEIALRDNIKAVLVCAISQIGNTYTLMARLVDPRSRVAFLTELAHVSTKDEILPSLDGITRNIREKLGESLTAIDSQRTPLPKATTSSLQALQSYGDAIRQTTGNTTRQLLLQSVELDPDFALAHAGLGHSFYLIGNRDKGEEHFTKALSLLDRLTVREKLWIQALTEDWRGKRDQAIQSYEKYLAQYPDAEDGWFRLGYAYMTGTQQYDAAARMFKRVVEINPNHGNAYINLATCYNALKKYPEALENYLKAFEIRPSYVTGEYINHEFGFMLVHMGKVQEAEETFRKMLAPEINRARQARGHRSMALLNMYLGKYSNAAIHLREAIAINEAQNSVLSEFRDRIYLATLLQAEGMNTAFDDQLAAMQRLMSKSGFAPQWFHFPAKLYARNGRTAGAEKILNNMSSRMGDRLALSSVDRTDRLDRASYHQVKGEVDLAHGRYAEALKQFEISAGLRDADAHLIESIAHAYAKMKNFAQAEKKYEELIQRSELGTEGQEYSILAYYELGKIHEQNGERDKAAERFRSFLSIWKDADPDLPPVRDSRARLARLQSPDRAGASIK